jgi:hypothetical protein
MSRIMLLTEIGLVGLIAGAAAAWIVCRESRRMRMAAKRPERPAEMLADYYDYVEQYRAASAALPEAATVFWPRLQTRGLLIELALKTYLCASGEIVKGHNLEALAKRAAKRGLSLSKEDWERRIKTVNDIYFRFEQWNAEFLSRYPIPNRPGAVWVTPGHEPLDEMIARIVSQARALPSEG